MKNYRRFDILMKIIIFLSSILIFLTYTGVSRISITGTGLTILFGVTIIGVLLVSIITFKKLATQFKSHNPKLLNLQFFVSILMFTDTIVTPILIKKSFEKLHVEKESGSFDRYYQIITEADTIKYTVEMICMWILIFTFNKFI